MRRTLLGIVAGALVAGLALAQNAPTVTLTWMAPTTYTNGTAIPTTETLTYTLYEGATGVETQAATGLTGTSDIVTTGLTAGASVCFELTATDVQKGTTSAKTSEVCTTIPQETPGAPTSLHLTLG